MRNVSYWKISLTSSAALRKGWNDHQEDRWIKWCTRIQSPTELDHPRIGIGIRWTQGWPLPWCNCGKWRIGGIPTSFGSNTIHGLSLKGQTVEFLRNNWDKSSEKHMFWFWIYLTSLFYHLSIVHQLTHPISWECFCDSGFLIPWWWRDCLSNVNDFSWDNTPRLEPEHSWSGGGHKDSG